MRIMIASQDWDYRFARPQQLARIFCERHDVDYLATGPGFVGRTRDVLHAAAPLRPPVFRVKSRLRAFPAGYLRDRDDPESIARNCRRNATVYHLLSPGTPEPDILVVTNPLHYPLVAQLKHRRLIYDCLDRYDGFYPDGSVLQAWVRENETKLLQEADIVFCSARLLCADKARIRPVHYLPHGVEVEHFERNAQPRPAELAGVSGSIIGFVGAIEHWLNFDWLAAAARALPQATFVMVGDVRTDIKAVAALPNIRFLGYRPYDQVPRCINAFDVCIIPFQINHLTAAVNPVKMLDYFALGKPVVSSYMPELEFYLPHVVLARTETEFTTGLRHLLEHDDPAARARRLVFARRRSWRRIAESFLDVVEGRSTRTAFEETSPA